MEEPNLHHLDMGNDRTLGTATWILLIAMRRSYRGLSQSTPYTGQGAGEYTSQPEVRHLRRRVASSLQELRWCTKQKESGWI